MAKRPPTKPKKKPQARVTGSPLMRRLTIIAQDPAVKTLKKGKRRILTAVVDVPYEPLDPGPTGHRVKVVDIDVTHRTRFKPAVIKAQPGAADAFARATDAVLLRNPHFHAQNVYAIIMRTLARFEFALGRRVAWQFKGHQIKVAPHAFLDPNAFYSRYDEGLVFGYFALPPAPGRRRKVGRGFTCLSHDIVAHETTHALLDALRIRFDAPSSADQAAFHEGFSDLVALMSILSLPEVVSALISKRRAVRLDSISEEHLASQPLFAVGEQLGEALSLRSDPLRASLALTPKIYNALPEAEKFESHRRGEVFVAAMLKAFVRVWRQRLESLLKPRTTVDREVVVDQGARIAEHLLTIAIRALDYTPPCDLDFRDYLSALVTSDAALFPVDEKFDFRKHVVDAFAEYGIKPQQKGGWRRCHAKLNYSTTHLESLQQDPQEVFRFIWDNRKALSLSPAAFPQVLSVRPSIRQGTDGFFLRETIAEYLEVLTLKASELDSFLLYPSDPSGNRKGRGTPLERPPGLRQGDVTLYGGATLVFDERGVLRYQIRCRIDNPRQQKRLNYLCKMGYFDRDEKAPSFAVAHQQRVTGMPLKGGW